METSKELIAAALETLRPTSSWERTTAAGQTTAEGTGLGGRGFGVAMDALIRYLGAEHGATFALGKFSTSYLPLVRGYFRGICPSHCSFCSW